MWCSANLPSLLNGRTYVQQRQYYDPFVRLFLQWNSHRSTFFIHAVKIQLLDSRRRNNKRRRVKCKILQLYYFLHDQDAFNSCRI